MDQFSSSFNILWNLNVFSALSGLPAVSLQDLLVRLIRLFFGLVGIVLVLMIIYGGFMWMTSGGDDEKKDNAKKLLVNAIVGIIIILAAGSIASYVIQFFSDLSPTSTSTPIF